MDAVAALVIGAAGFVISISKLVSAFETVAQVRPDDKTAVLHAAIAEAMPATAVAAPLASLLYVGSIMLFAIG